MALAIQMLRGILPVVLLSLLPWVAAYPFISARNSVAHAPVALPAGRLLVVAQRTFHPDLQEFVRYKRRTLPTDLVALEDVLKRAKGEDDPARLKRYLFDRWKRDNVRYVLLVGDVDVMPVRYMVLDRVTPAAFDYAFYPSDLYYADLAKADGTFEDWNARRDDFHAHYYGEVRGEKNKTDAINYDSVDYLPDVAVGRWPVSTREQVRTVAAKSLAYENSLKTGAHPGAKRTALFAVGGWVDSRGQMDGLASNLPAGWQTEKRYYADAGRNDKTAPPNRGELVSLLNSGASLVFHTGHGSENTWEGCFAPADLTRLKNADRLPVMFSAGCSTAFFAPLPPYTAYVDESGVEHPGTDKGEKFTSPPPAPAPYQKGKYNFGGLGERLLRDGPNGAVAYIGCNTGSQPCALTLQAGFVKTLHEQTAPRLGDCWNGALRHYFTAEHLATLKPNNDWYPPSIFFQGMKFMLFGDPSLPMTPSLPPP
jgi:hypothetical protein